MNTQNLAVELRTAAARLRDTKHDSACNNPEIHRAALDAGLLNAREPLANWLERVAWSHDSLNIAADEVLGGRPEHAEVDEILRRGPYDMGEALSVARIINGTNRAPEVIAP